MKNKHRFLAALFAVLLTVQMLPLGVAAKSGTRLSREAETTQQTQPTDAIPAQPSTDWPETGMVNPDGSPVTADEGDVPDSGLTTQEPVFLAAGEPATYVLSLDLGGGQVNGLPGAGWNQSALGTYVWTREVSDTDGTGYSLTPDSTLGGLLPETPYRAGYDFLGWTVGDPTGSIASGPVTLTADTTITARWEIRTYQVQFVNGDASSLWSVDVPYGATLWTDAQTPWTDAGVTWDAQQMAQVDISLGGVTHEKVVVTRHQGEENLFYYTFTIEGAFYFTYGGADPAMPGLYFAAWKMTAGGSGFTVFQDSTFTAQYVAGETYLVNVYYYYADGTRVAEIPTQIVAVSETELQEGQFSFQLNAKEISYYNWSLGTAAGVSESGGTVTVKVDEAYNDSADVTKFLSLTVTYQPVEITYTIEYYQQKVGAGTAVETDYEQVGSIPDNKAPYGSIVDIPNPPDDSTSFAGFEVSSLSLAAVHGGILLAENISHVTVDENSKSATVKIYYDRVSYFIYFQTGTAEVQLDPVKVQYGAAIPPLSDFADQLSRVGYAPVTESDIDLYYLQDGNLVSAGEKPGSMPPYDLYAVVNWKPATTSIRILYWVEDRNAPSFQNAYTKIIDGVTTESILTVGLKDGVTIQGDGWPSGTDGNTAVADGFRDLVVSRYQEDFTTFFSYSEENTRTSPGNVANAGITETGEVTEGKIAADTYNVKVKGDGTTTINVYYTRNLYTLEFVIARENGDQLQAGTDGPKRTFEDTRWENFQKVEGQPFTDYAFADFTGNVTITYPSPAEYGELSVEREYRISTTDMRAPVGRYGTKTITDQNTNVSYNCYVYTLTARFEADISSLWPTDANLKGNFPHPSTVNPGVYFDYSYISMRSNEESYYNKAAETTQKNILGVYSTMDRDVVAVGTKESWTATSDKGDGAICHRLIAYWSGPRYFEYYFLYETLDTRTADGKDADGNFIEEFNAEKADRTIDKSPEGDRYTEGQLVSYQGIIYEFRTADRVIQKSTAKKIGQNQPAKQGFANEGKAYTGNDVDLGAAADENPPNIYFFYTRQDFTLDIQNVNGQYKIPGGLLTTGFTCLGENNAEVTLQQQGWETVTDGKATIRYGGNLCAMGESQIINWLTSVDRANQQLTHPISIAGENQYYFSRWYRNANQTVSFDWTAPEMQTISSDMTLYAGWTLPRYTTSYVLNGGVWQDSVAYTLIGATIDDEKIFLYYPHQTQEETATVYWYSQTQASDRLYVNTLYTCRVQDVLEKDSASQHWRLRTDLTLKTLQDISAIDQHGSRLVDNYYCYMGENGTDSTKNHENYVNINTVVNTVLQEPVTPKRHGYDFRGWFHFDPEPTDQDANRIYLKEVLTDNQSISSYGEHHVYRNTAGEAFLLQTDENGELYYYPDQTGYRYSYANDAAIVSQSRALYAAWEATSDATGIIYHLVEKENAPESFTTKDGVSIPVSAAETITIGTTEYYILRKDTTTLQSLYTGTTWQLSADEYYTVADAKKWLPVQATIQLQIDDSTQTVDSPGDAASNTYRIPDGEGYQYYACFVYQPGEDVSYHVYAIDLAAAVAAGALTDYQAVFDRAASIPTDAPYVLKWETKSWGSDTAQITENAPRFNGYQVYRNWTQTLQLQSDSGTNNIFFYYVKDAAAVTYSITYYLMRDGQYSPDNRVEISSIPAVSGEIVDFSHLLDTYAQLLTLAETYSGYGDSDNEGKKALYERYKGMTITWSHEGNTKTFTVAAGDTDTLELGEITQLPLDYYLDGWSPKEETLVISDGAAVDVYLGMAQLLVRKVNQNGDPLQGATFTLERLVKQADGEIVVDGTTYGVDDTFPKMEVTTTAEGIALFQNLSARTAEDGSGYRYRLTETKAPAGYNQIQSPMYVEAPYTVNGTTSYQVTYTVVNSGITYLPSAGFFGGAYTTSLFGGGLIAASFVCTVCLPRKHRRENPYNRRRT